MPFLNEGLRDYIGHRQLPTLENALTELETQRGAPVRMLELGNEGRDRAGHTRWQGGARQLTHYAEGTTEDDFAHKGITIFMRAWNNNGDDTNGTEPEWFYRDFDLNALIAEPLGRYADGRENMTDNPNLEIYGYQATQIEGFDGATPIIVGGVEMGEVWDEGRCVYLNSGLYSLFGYGIPTWDKILVEPVVAAGDPELLAQIAQEQMERARNAFTLMMQDRGDTAITEARTRMAQFAIEAAEMQEKVVNALGNRDQYARQLAYLLDQEGDLTDEMVRQEWDGIANNAMIERFTAGHNEAEHDLTGRMTENPYLKVFTKQLWITNPENHRKMPLGKYEVTMNFGANTLRIRNLTMPQHGATAINQQRWDHPHVQNGRLCTAEYATAITTLLRDRKLAQMTNMMFSILNTVTLNDDWGRNNIRLWEAADDELRTEKGWPAWTPDETEHPMVLAEQETTDNA